MVGVHEQYGRMTRTMFTTAFWSTAAIALAPTWSRQAFALFQGPDDSEVLVSVPLEGPRRHKMVLITNILLVANLMRFTSAKALRATCGVMSTAHMIALEARTEYFDFFPNRRPALLRGATFTIECGRDTPAGGIMIERKVAAQLRYLCRHFNDKVEVVAKLRHDLRRLVSTNPPNAVEVVRCQKLLRIALAAEVVI